MRVRGVSRKRPMYWRSKWSHLQSLSFSSSGVAFLAYIHAARSWEIWQGLKCWRGFNFTFFSAATTSAPFVIKLIIQWDFIGFHVGIMYWMKWVCASDSRVNDARYAAPINYLAKQCEVESVRPRGREFNEVWLCGDLLFLAWIFVFPTAFCSWTECRCDSRREPCANNE